MVVIRIMFFIFEVLLIAQFLTREEYKNKSNYRNRKQNKMLKLTLNNSAVGSDISSEDDDDELGFLLPKMTKSKSSGWIIIIYVFATLVQKVIFLIRQFKIKWTFCGPIYM